MPEAIVVSLIVCTRNRADELAKTVESIGQCEVPTGMFCELIVVDNGSTDATPQVLAAVNLPNMMFRSLREPQPGKSRALNAAMAVGRGSVFLFTDDDVRVPRNWITAMAAPILAGKADGVCGGARPAPHLVRPSMSKTEEGLMVSSEHTPASELRDPFLIGINMAFRAEVLTRLGGFDEEVGPGVHCGMCEDVLFSLQFKEAGFRIITAMNVIVEHHFDPQRLSHAGVLYRPVVEGRASAYIRHHWQHGKIRLARLRLWKHQIQLRWMRMKHRGEISNAMACPDWEIDLVRDVEFYKQYLIECQRPRNYAKGSLLKIGTDPEAALARKDRVFVRGMVQRTDKSPASPAGKAR